MFRVGFSFILLGKISSFRDLLTWGGDFNFAVIY